MNLDSPYSLPDLWRIFWSLLLTKIFFSEARIIRQPSRVRGYKNMKIGKGFTTGQYCRIEANPGVGGGKTLIIGDNVQINDKCHFAAMVGVSIGDNVLVASNVFISDHDHGQFNRHDLSIPPADRELVCKPVIIEKNVWIGENVIILKGVKIGESSIIAAGSVVTKDMPSFCLIAGVPAKVKKLLEDDNK
jgi:acetyltransferase-like isoleucine patch superfamily enzyme